MAPMMPIIDMLIATVSMIKGPEEDGCENTESDCDCSLKWVVEESVT